MSPQRQTYAHNLKQQRSHRHSLACYVGQKTTETKVKVLAWLLLEGPEVLGPRALLSSLRIALWCLPGLPFPSFHFTDLTYLLVCVLLSGKPVGRVFSSHHAGPAAHQAWGQRVYFTEPLWSKREALGS